MTIEQASRDGEVKDLLRIIFQHRAFNKLRIAFTNHSPKGDDHSPTSIEVAHGTNLGTRYVFNKIEELAIKPAESNIPKPKRQGGPDPDL